MFHGVASKGVGAVRKRTTRNGMRLIMAALVPIVLASFCHMQLSELSSSLDIPVREEQGRVRPGETITI